jgi:hypothetical protein
MRHHSRALALVLLAPLALGAALLAQAPSQTAVPVLGSILLSKGGSVGNTTATAGSSVFSEDFLSTQDKGALLLRIGPLSLQLESSSSMHVYEAPYGAVVELNRGSVIYKTPGNARNVVIVANDVRVTPDVTLADLGRVRIESPCTVSVFSQRGQAEVRSGKESRIIEQGKAYNVRTENNINYRKYLSPDDENYHRYHEHEPCVLPYKESHFLLSSAAAIGGGTVYVVHEALESSDKP